MQKLILLLSILFLGFNSNAQFTKLASGIEYKFIKKGKGTKTAKPGDYMAVIMKGVCGKKVMFDTKAINKGNNVPVNFPAQKPSFNGDVMEVLLMLHEGDSVQIKIPQDSFYRRMPQAQRTGVVAGDPIVYNGALYTIHTAAEWKKMQEDYKKQMEAMKKQQAAFAKQQAEAQKQQKIQAAALKHQDADIQKYIADNKIENAVKQPSGLYVAITQEGTGDFAKPGYDVTMNYDGQLLNGKKFDSNVDTTFHHVQPFKFKLGVHQVIAGWDEGVQKLKVGSKATLIIPSSMAYGPQAQEKIPANSPLRFDVELVDMKDPVALAKAEDDKIQEYFKANNITNAIKTNSGLYYAITQEGSGENPKTTDTVTMNYTGMFLDGKKFDSNVDSAFGHVAPFTFPLGMHRVINGWDEGVALLKKGSKAKLFIPSVLGYGANNNGAIPANSILQFDVELVNFIKGPGVPKQTMPQTINIGGKNVKLTPVKKNK